MKKNKNILWSGPLFDPSGYGSASRLYIRSFFSIGIKPYLRISSYTKKIINNYQDLPLRTEIDVLERYKDVPDIFINHITPDIAFTINAPNNIIFTVWETDCIPFTFVNKCNNFDKIITASAYSKNAFINGKVNKPVEIIPHPIVVRTYKVDPVLVNKFKDKFVFFSNFEWHLGKGYDILIPAFSKAFESNKDVVLIIKTYNMDVAGKYNKVSKIKELKGNKEFPSIILIDGLISEDNLYNLYSLCNIYVSLSRREGFGLCAAEAVAFNKPVIAPSIGGHVEFLKYYNSFISIESNMREVSKNIELSRILYRGQKWVEPDFDSTVEMLRKSYYDYSSFNSDNTTILADFSLETIGRKFIKAIE